MDAALGRLNANASDLPNGAGLESLRHAAAQNDPAAIAATAQKFEGLFAQEMIKSMRAASGPDSMFPGQSQTYRDLYDKEVATQMTRGKGLGLQAMIRQSLGEKAAAAAPTAAAPAASATGKPATSASSATATHFTPRTSAVAVPSAMAALARMTGKATNAAPLASTVQRASAPSAAGATSPTLSASARASLRAASSGVAKPAAPSTGLTTGLVRPQQAAMSLANYRRVLPAQAPVTSSATAPVTPAPAVTPGAAAAAPVSTPATPGTASVGATSRIAARALPVSTASSHSLSNPGSGRQPPQTVGSPTPLSSGAPNRSFSPEDFVAKVWPHAQRAAAALGVAPEALVAQAALETGWGKYVGANNNLFGIKASGGWKGATQTLPTTEVRNGQMQTERAAFRSYASIGDSFDDYVKLLKGSPRYAAALGSGSDTARFAGALQKAGYATDPAYASKIAALARTPMLAQATLQKAAGAPLIASR